MNLKSKAIQEIRSTILTLSAHPEFADRIEGLQVLLGELESEQGGKGVPTEQEIKNASKAHYMQYDGEYDSIAVADKAYQEAAQWAISQMQPEWVPCAEGLPGESQFTYEVCDIDDTEEEWYMKASYSGVRKLYEKGRITHYKLYVKPQPPTK